MSRANLRTLPRGAGFGAVQRGVFTVRYLAGQVMANALSTGAPAIDTLLCVPLLYRGRGRIESIAFHVTTAGAAGSVARVGLYQSLSADDIRPGALIFDGGEQVTTVGGFKATVLPTPFALREDRLYWLAYLCGVAAPTLRTVPGTACYPIFGVDTGGGTGIHVGRSASQAYGALPDPYTATQAHLTSGGTIPALYYRVVP